MFDKLKRKNDDKAKFRSFRPRMRVRMALVVACLLIIGYLLQALMPRSIPYPQFPAARLYYTSDGHPYTLNLQTGERTPAQRPEVVIDSDAPTDILDAQALMESDDHKLFEPSPDGEWFVAWKHIRDHYEWELMLYDRLGQGRSRSLGVFHGIHWGARIRWSPDSQSIILSAHTPPPPGERMSFENEELWRVSIPAGETTRLTENNFRDSQPSFSPDGTQIAYTSTADGYHRLYIMELDTRESRLISEEIFAYASVWSPDGQWIAFSNNKHDPSGDIWIIRPDGTDAQAVTTGSTMDEAPDWLP